MAYRILFIDDNPKSMESYRERFDPSAYTIESESDVEAALKKFTKKTFDLLILDVMMPPGPFGDTKAGLDTGSYIFEHLRKLHPELPVVVFSNLDDFVDFEKYEGDPNLYTLRKEDYRPSQLRSKIEDILLQKSKRAELLDSASHAEKLAEDG